MLSHSSRTFPASYPSLCLIFPWKTAEKLRPGRRHTRPRWHFLWRVLCRPFRAGHFLPAEQPTQGLRNSTARLCRRRCQSSSIGLIYGIAVSFTGVFLFASLSPSCEQAVEPRRVQFGEAELSDAQMNRLYNRIKGIERKSESVNGRNRVSVTTSSSSHSSPALCLNNW